MGEEALLQEKNSPSSTEAMTIDTLFSLLWDHTTLCIALYINLVILPSITLSALGLQNTFKICLRAEVWPSSTLNPLDPSLWGSGH